MSKYVRVDDVMAFINTSNRGNCDYFIVDQIEELCNSNKAIQIVKDLASEHNNGWISVEDELPNVTRCRVTVQYDMDFGEVVYDTMDATFSRFGIFGSEYRFEDSWRNDITNNVIAWKHLDTPYKKGE